MTASPRRVWGAVVDFEARPRWSTRVKKAQIAGGGPLKEGSRILLQVGRDRFAATVTEVSPPQRLALLVRGPGFRATHAYEVCPEGNNATLVIKADYSGVIGVVVRRFMRGSVQKDLAEELEAIKKAAEISPAG